MTTASIVTYRTPDSDLTTALRCILADGVDKVYVVDNASEERVRGIAESFSDVVYIPNANTGFGAGHNIAIREASLSGARYHLVANADTYWKPGVVSSLVSVMDANADVALITPKVFYPDGRLQYTAKMCPTPLDLIFKRFLPPSLARRRMKRFTLAFTGYDRVMDVPYMHGCFMLFRVAPLVEIGMFDERFFMYPEDIDITRRLHEKYRTLFYPGVSIVHAHAAASRTSLRMLRIHISNMIRYFNKWGWLNDPQRRAANRRLQRVLRR